MKPQEFIEKYKGDALKASKITGIPISVIFTQAAIESGWGKKMVGNAFFGIKDTDGVNGNEQLILTTEYHSTPNIEYPKIDSITKITKDVYKYKVWAYFRKYNTPADSFIDYCNFLKNNPRYKLALTLKDPLQILIGIVKAGYATDPNYIKLVQGVYKIVIKYL